MGASCCKGDAPATSPSGVTLQAGSDVLSPPPPPPGDHEALADWLLERLLAAAPNEVALPVRAHRARLRSGARGFSVAFLRALHRFLRRHGADELHMDALCKQPGLPVSVCRLTASTGLSLVESCALLAEAERLDASALFGDATSFFSYSWTGTRVDAMVAAAERGIAQLDDAAAAPPRFLWLDMLCASQNLLAVRRRSRCAGLARPPLAASHLRPPRPRPTCAAQGKYKDERFAKGSAEYAARKEDTDSIFDDALNTTREIIFYLAPLVGEWPAPDHPPLRADRAPPPPGWMRSGPVAITRACAPPPRPLARRPTPCTEMDPRSGWMRGAGLG